MTKNEKGSASRATIIERVTTPIGFFTLGILVIEAILLSLALKVSGTDLTILIVGMLIGFLLLLSMVFVLTLRPQLRQALLGVEVPFPALALRDMNLTPNDIRMIDALWKGHGTFEEISKRVVVGEKPLPPEGRIEKFKKLDIIQPTISHVINYELNRNGNAIADLIRDFHEAMTTPADKIKG